MPSSILLFLHLGVGQVQFRRNHSGCRIFWHLFTQFSLSRTSPPSSPRLTSTADNLGAELFFWKSLNLIIIENTNRSFFINRSSSTKTSVFFQFPWHLFATVSLVPPSPISWSSAIAISSSLIRKNVWIFLAKKSTLVHWNESEQYIPLLCPIRPFSLGHRGQISGKKLFASGIEKERHPKQFMRKS